MHDDYHYYNYDTQSLHLHNGMVCRLCRHSMRSLKNLYSHMKNYIENQIDINYYSTSVPLLRNSIINLVLSLKV